LGKIEYYPIWEIFNRAKFVNARIFGNKSGLSFDINKQYIFDEFANSYLTKTQLGAAKFG
jgi:hypothetical protein